MTPQIDLVTFLTARLDEDEAYARQGWESFGAGDLPDMVLRQITAARAILAAHAPDCLSRYGSQGEPQCKVCITQRDCYPEYLEGDDWPCLTLRHLLAIYSDHPGYQQDWVPYITLSG